MKKKLKSNLFIGVLSGTSADSIDAGLFKIDKKISFLNFASTKYDEKLKDAILDISRNKKLPSKEILTARISKAMGLMCTSQLSCNAIILIFFAKRTLETHSCPPARSSSSTENV